MQDHAIGINWANQPRLTLDSDVVDGDKNVILDQVSNGVFVRMAILLLLTDGDARVLQSLTVKF